MVRRVLRTSPLDKWERDRRTDGTLHQGLYILNISKTNYIIFTSKGKSCNKSVSNIKIDGNNLEQVNKTKFLGIVIEEHLNWAMHISHLCNIIARNVGILQKLRYFIPAYVLQILYH